MAIELNEKDEVKKRLLTKAEVKMSEEISIAFERLCCMNATVTSIEPNLAAKTVDVWIEDNGVKRRFTRRY